MYEPMMRAWMTESVKPASHHEVLPGRWVAEASWPPPGITPQLLFLTDAGLRNEAAPLTARTVCSSQTVGKCSGSWVPFGRGHDQAEDQHDDDARSLIFETPPLEEPIEMLGAAIVTLELTVREPRATDALLKPLPGPESAPPEKPTIIRRSDLRIERIDRLDLELGTHDESKLHVEEDDPLSAVIDLRRTWTMSRDAWEVRIETQMRLSCTREVFLLQASLRAWEGANEVCRRDWDRAIARDFL